MSITMKRTTPSPNKTLKHVLAHLPAYGCLIPWTILVCIPLAVLVTGAFKTVAELFGDPLALPRRIDLSSFTNAWQRANLGPALLSSLFITCISVAGLVLIGSMAAYPLARRTGLGYRSLYIYFLVGVLLPVGLSIVPLYQLIVNLHLLNTYYSLILVYIAGNMPFVVFLYSGFIKTVPYELEESARLDGANQFQVFWRVIFPLLTPVTATVIIVTSLSIWNDFLLPLLFLQDPSNQTLPVAIYTFVGAYGENNWPYIFASIIMGSIPMIGAFLFLQKYFVKGLTSGAVRG